MLGPNIELPWCMACTVVFTWCFRKYHWITMVWYILSCSESNVDVILSIKEFSLNFSELNLGLTHFTISLCVSIVRPWFCQISLGSGSALQKVSQAIKVHHCKFHSLQVPFVLLARFSRGLWIESQRSVWLRARETLYRETDASKLNWAYDQNSGGRGQ